MRVFEHEDVQTVRLFDVFVLGPVMVYAAVMAKGLHPVIRGVLGASGVMTVLYNGGRYADVQAQAEAERAGSVGGLGYEDPRDLSGVLRIYGP